MIRVVRHPNGVWSAIGSVPVSTGLFTVREIVDETPLRAEALRRVTQVMAPEIRAKCGSTPDGRVQQNELFWHMVRIANRVADALIDRRVREELAKKVGFAIRNATRTLSNAYRALPRNGANGPAAATGAVPQGPNPMVVAQLLMRFAQGDDTARQQILEVASRVSKDPKSRALMNAIINRAAMTPVANTLRALFGQYGMPKLAYVLDRRVMSNRARFGPARAG